MRFSFHRALPVALAVLLLASPLHGQELGETAGFEAVVEAWDRTARGSQEEKDALQAVEEFINTSLGAGTLPIFRTYLAAPIGSDEETQALADLEAALPEGVRMARAREMLGLLVVAEEITADPESYGFAEDPETSPGTEPNNAVVTTGTLTALAPVDPVVILERVDGFSPGEGIFVEGRVVNESEHWILLPQSSISLTVPPVIHELAGLETRTLPGRFMVGAPRWERGGEVWAILRPSGSVRVEWDMDAAPLTDRVRSYLSALPLLNQDPNTESIRGDIEMQYVALDKRPPNDPAAWVDPRPRAVTSGELYFSYEHSLLYLLPLVWLGGLLGLAVQALHSPEARQGWSVGKGVTVGSASIALTTTVAVLNVFATEIPLLPSLLIESPGQAVAAGIMIQVIGYVALIGKLPQLVSARDGDEAGGGGAGGGGDPIPAPQ